MHGIVWYSMVLYDMALKKCLFLGCSNLLFYSLSKKKQLRVFRNFNIDLIITFTTNAFESLPVHPLVYILAVTLTGVVELAVSLTEDVEVVDLNISLTWVVDLTISLTGVVDMTVSLTEVVDLTISLTEAVDLTILLTEVVELVECTSAIFSVQRINSNAVNLVNLTVNFKRGKSKHTAPLSVPLNKVQGKGLLKYDIGKVPPKLRRTKSSHNRGDLVGTERTKTDKDCNMTVIPNIQGAEELQGHKPTAIPFATGSVTVDDPLKWYSLHINSSGYFCPCTEEFSAFAMADFDEKKNEINETFCIHSRLAVNILKDLDTLWEVTPEILNTDHCYGIDPKTNKQTYMGG
ncbi:hypothetical protein KUTeg_015167 [Tegillarca granosa]|uniref:SWIM-type domain-containing protein n=1 Tax=Tegillarca granosa TaxID=220873 RepID=A0ABQ9EPC5_TEGGR|nr:hypothetical protein KUTeg_015167 [Tegillarca granosa]